MITQGYIERNTQNRIVGRLKKIISINPSQVQALKLEEGKFVFINDPYRNDIVILLEILCTKRNRVLFFKEFSVKVGSMVTFVSELYSVSGEIIGIEKNNVKEFD